MEKQSTCFLAVHMNFIKYHSLENDFIIIKEDASYLSGATIRQLCDRRRGIGADGILALENDSITIFNRDGSQGDVCLNGLRCVAHHILTTRDQASCTLHMAHRTYTCTRHIATDTITINVMIPPPRIDHHTITINNRTYNGRAINIGNPHFIVHEHITSSQLRDIGPIVETHELFPHHTNVEFVWQKDGVYHMLIHERGCGQTPACSSGATALVLLLIHTQKIDYDTPISIHMPGGILTASITSDGIISLTASAHMIYAGTINC